MIPDYKYKIKKRQAFKVETIAAPKERPVQSKAITHTQYFSYTKAECPKTCIICGANATLTAHFRIQEIELLERYCFACLDKFVIQ